MSMIGLHHEILYKVLHVAERSGHRICHRTFVFFVLALLQLIHYHYLPGSLFNEWDIGVHVSPADMSKMECWHPHFISFLRLDTLDGAWFQSLYVAGFEPLHCLQVWHGVKEVRGLYKSRVVKYGTVWAIVSLTSPVGEGLARRALRRTFVGLNS